MMTKTATKKEAARFQREINARQKCLTFLRAQPDNGGYGHNANGVPTPCQQLVDEMTALGTQRRALLGEAV